MTLESHIAGGQEEEDAALTPRTQEFAGHIGIDLNDPEDTNHLWLARKAVREPLPDGWSQHEDDDGFLFFYDAILDKSSWEHPQEGYWKRILEDERRKAVRENEVRSIEEQIATMAEGEAGRHMLKELKARFIKADVAALEGQMMSTRSQVESMQLNLMNNSPDEEGRTREQVRKHMERLKKELRQTGEVMRSMLMRLEKLMKPEEDEPEVDPHKFDLDDQSKKKKDVRALCVYVCEWVGEWVNSSRAPSPGPVPSPSPATSCNDMQHCHRWSSRPRQSKTCASILASTCTQSRTSSPLQKLHSKRLFPMAGRSPRHPTASSSLSTQRPARQWASIRSTRSL